MIDPIYDLSIFRSSLISKLVSPDEVGKVLSVVTAISCASPFINAPVFAQLYIHTVKDAPNTFLYVIAAVFTVNFLLILAVRFRVKRSEKALEQDAQAPEEMKAMT